MKTELRPIAEEDFMDAFRLMFAPGQVALTCNKNNSAAGRLFARIGFSATGIEDKDELELAVNVRSL